MKHGIVMEMRTALMVVMRKTVAFQNVHLISSNVMTTTVSMVASSVMDRMTVLMHQMKLDVVSIYLSAYQLTFLQPFERIVLLFSFYLNSYLFFSTST